MAKFLKSNQIKVFPSAYRGPIWQTSKLGGLEQIGAYNPESRLNSEFNYAKLASRSSTTTGKVGSYIIKPEKSNNAITLPIKIECVIHGYWFNFNLTTEDLNNLGNDIYAKIKVQDRLSSDSSTDFSTEYRCNSLVSLKETTNEISNPAPEAVLDSKISGTTDSEFTGLEITNEGSSTNDNIFYLHLLTRKDSSSPWTIPNSSYLQLRTIDIADTNLDGDANTSENINEHFNTHKVHVSNNENFDVFINDEDKEGKPTLTVKNGFLCKQNLEGTIVWWIDNYGNTINALNYNGDTSNFPQNVEGVKDAYIYFNSSDKWEADYTGPTGKRIYKFSDSLDFTTSTEEREYDKIDANIQPEKHVITLSFNEGNTGTYTITGETGKLAVSLKGEYIKGEDLKLNIIAEDGYNLNTIRVTVDGKTTGVDWDKGITSGILTIDKTLTNTNTLTINIINVKVRYYINIASNVNGLSVEPNDETIKTYGSTTLTFKYQAEDGYNLPTVEKWKESIKIIGDTGVVTESGYSIEDGIGILTIKLKEASAASSITINANGIAISYPVSTQKGEGIKSIEKSSSEIKKGTTVTITITAEDGYKVENKDNCEVANATLKSYTPDSTGAKAVAVIENPTGEVTITVVGEDTRPLKEINMLGANYIATFPGGNIIHVGDVNVKIELTISDGYTRPNTITVAESESGTAETVTLNGAEVHGITYKEDAGSLYINIAEIKGDREYYFTINPDAITNKISFIGKTGIKIKTTDETGEIEKTTPCCFKVKTGITQTFTRTAEWDNDNIAIVGAYGYSIDNLVDPKQLIITTTSTDIIVVITEN